MEFILAQAEASRRRQEQNPLSDPQQLINQLIGGQLGGQPAMNGMAQAGPSQADIMAQRSADNRATAFYNASGRGDSGGRRGNSDHAIASVLNNLIDNQQQGATQRAIADRQLMAGQQLGQREAMMAGLNTDHDIFQELLTRQLPDDIQMGLNDQSLFYPPDLKRSMADDQNALAKVDRSNNLTPEEKAIAKREIAQRLWEKRVSAQPNPNQPLTLPEKFEQETAVVEIGGQQVRIARGERNGSPDWKVIEPPKDQAVEAQKQQQDMEFKQQEFERRWAEKDQDQSYKEQQQALDLQKRKNDFRISTIEKLRDAQLAGLTAPTPDEFHGAIDAEGNSKPDMKKFGAAQAEYERKVNEIISRYQGMLEAPDVVGEQAAPPEQGATQSDPNAPPDWYLQLPSGAYYTAPDGSTRVKP